MFSLPTGFQQSLIPASYNGVPFFVIDTGIKTGIRAAIHEFPARDIPYAEPLGKQARMFSFTAFLVGDAFDLQAQYGALLNQIEINAPGTLVHPVLGQLQVVPIAAEFQQNTAGRVVEIRFQFVEAGQVIYPSNGMDTQSDTITIASQAQATGASSFNNDTGSTFGSATAADAGNAKLADAGGVNPTSGTPAQDSLNAAGDTAVDSNGTGFDF